MEDSSINSEITPAIIEQARYYIEVGLDYLIKNDPGYDMLYTAVYWAYMNFLIRIDMADIIKEAHTKHVKSLRFDKNTVLSDLDNLSHATIKEFFTYMYQIDDMSRRDVMDCMDGLSLAIKERIYNSVVNNDYNEFESVVRETNYDFATSSKMAHGIFIYKNICTCTTENIDYAFTMHENPYLSDYLNSKFPDIDRIDYTPLDNLNEEELKLLGQYQKWSAGIWKAYLDCYLSNLPSSKRKLVISKIPLKTYEAYQKIEYPEDLDLLSSLMTNDDRKTWLLNLEQKTKNFNKNEEEKPQEQQEITPIDEDKMKKVFKAIYWNGLDDNPNANVDTLVMYIKDLKSDAKTKSVDYARVAYIIFGCEYFIEENPDTGRAWTFSAWYKHFCNICDVKYNDNYKDYNNIIPENPKYMKFQRILPKRKK